MGEALDCTLTLIIPSAETPTHILVARGGGLPELEREGDERILGEKDVVQFGRKVLNRFLSPYQVAPDGKGGRIMTTKPVSNATVNEGKQYWWVPIESLEGRDVAE
jgi:hypothetical protein